MQQRLPTNKRWGIAFVLFLGILINYFDRTNMSVATTHMMEEYQLTTAQWGWIMSSFAWTYALMQIPIGALLDKVGVKWLMRVGTLIWAIATLATAVVSGLGFVILARLLLGVGEAPAFPAASKATGYWFPLRERGVATATFDAAAKFSNVIGTPLVAWAVTEWGWRGGFYLTAALSFIYAIIFWIWYRDPKEHPTISKEELAYIEEGGAQVSGEAPGGVWKNFAFLLKQRKVWGLTLGFAAYGYTFYLLLTWLPGYLQTQMHMSVLKSAAYTAIPWTVATITDFFIGGFLVDKLVQKGYDQSKVRKTLFTIGLLMGLAVGGAGFTDDPDVAIIYITIALSGLAFAAPIGWSIPAIIAPQGTVGMVGSIMNLVNNVMGIMAPVITGYLATGGSFAEGFKVAAVVLVIGVVAFTVLMGPIERIKSPFETQQ